MKNKKKLSLITIHIGLTLASAPFLSSAAWADRLRLNDLYRMNGEDDEFTRGACEEEVLSRPPVAAQSDRLNEFTRTANFSYNSVTGLLVERETRFRARIEREFHREPTPAEFQDELTQQRLDAVQMQRSSGYIEFLRNECRDEAVIANGACNAGRYPSHSIMHRGDRRDCIINELRIAYSQRNSLNLQRPFPDVFLGDPIVSSPAPTAPPAPPAAPLANIPDAPPPAGPESDPSLPEVTATTLPASPEVLPTGVPAAPSATASQTPSTAAAPSSSSATSSGWAWQSSLPRSPVSCVRRVGIACLMNAGAGFTSNDNSALNLGVQSRVAIVAPQSWPLVGGEPLVQIAGYISMPILSGGSRVGAEVQVLRVPLYRATHRNGNGAFEFYIAPAQLRAMGDLYRNDGQNLQATVQFDSSVGVELGFNPGNGPVRLVGNINAGFQMVQQAASRGTNPHGGQPHESQGMGVNTSIRASVPVNFIAQGSEAFIQAQSSLGIVASGDLPSGLVSAAGALGVRIPVERQAVGEQTNLAPRSYIEIFGEGRAPNLQTQDQIPWEAGVGARWVGPGL